VARRDQQNVRCRGARGRCAGCLARTSHVQQHGGHSGVRSGRGLAATACSSSAACSRTPSSAACSSATAAATGAARRVQAVVMHERKLRGADQEAGRAGARHPALASRARYVRARTYMCPF
jgi:hypothetical protein